MAKLWPQQTKAHVKTCLTLIGKIRNKKIWQADQIKPKAQEGSDDPDNFQILCCECHMEKTTAENKKLNIMDKLTNT